MTSNYIQVDEVLRRFAWKLLRKRVNWFSRLFLKEENFVASVDWSYLAIQDRLVKFEPAQPEGTVLETNWGDVTTGTKWVTIWSCDFDNKSDVKQSHTFSGSRDTTTWINVDLDQYFTLDKDVKVSVNIPPTFTKIRAGRDNTLTINTVKGQVFKELLTWDVNSQVEVTPGGRAHAQLLAKQESQAVNFEIRSTLFNPKGVVPVTFKQKSDGRTVYVVNLHNFHDAFVGDGEESPLTEEEKPFVQVMTQQIVDKNGELKSKTYPQLITKGSFISLCWTNQRVDIQTIPNPSDEPESPSSNTYYASFLNKIESKDSVKESS